MKIKNGVIKMTHRERMRMWAGILNEMQRYSVKKDTNICKGICNHILCNTPLSFKGRDIFEVMSIIEKSFPEFIKYKPFDAEGIGRWWSKDIPMKDITNKNWYAPRIECVNNILKDLQFGDFPEYHDKYLFPYVSQCLFDYLERHEQYDIYADFYTPNYRRGFYTVHYQFWKIHKAFQRVKTAISDWLEPIFAPIIEKVNNRLKSK